MTCWEDNPPPGQTAIIEIGVCPLAIRTPERGERRSLLVKPVQSQISAFCTQLTTLTPGVLAEADTHHRGGDDAWNIARILADWIGRTRGN